MIYSSETFKSNLLIDIILIRFEHYIKHVMQNVDKSEALEAVAFEIKSLRKELINPVVLKKCIYKFGDLDVVSDEEVKNYLFSILTPKKLQTLRSWLINKDNIRAHSEYKVDLILHTYLANFASDIYEKQPIRVNNEIRECNIPLEALLNLIEKTANCVISNCEDEAPTSEVVIAELKILRNEIFYSNSTILYSHEPSSSDEASNDKVKDYLFSMLSAEKLKALRKWLYNKESLITENDHKLGIVTSIYVPDLGG